MEDLRRNPLFNPDGDTDVGRDITEQIGDLERLLAAYRNGEIIEKL